MCTATATDTSVAWRGDVAADDGSAYTLRGKAHLAVGDADRGFDDLEKGGLLDSKRLCLVCMEHARGTRSFSLSMTRDAPTRRHRADVNTCGLRALCAPCRKSRAPKRCCESGSYTHPFSQRPDPSSVEAVAS